MRHSDTDPIEWFARLCEGPEPEFVDLFSPQWFPTLLVNATAVFTQAGTLPSRISLSHLNKALTRIHMDWLLTPAIWDAGQPWATRHACISSMLPLFRDLFATTDLDEACYMWWDNLRWPAKTEDPVVVPALLGAMEAVLALKSERCTYSALHGLGHFAHSGGSEIIRRWLAADPSIDGSVRAFAEEASRGDVL